MIDELKCLGCRYYDKGWCKRWIYGNEPTKDEFDTREGITVTIYDVGLLIPIRDITKCNLNC